MDPLSGLLAGHVGSKLVDAFASAFRVNVIERWSRIRAEAFVEEFVAHVAYLSAKPPSADLGALLDNIISDELCSQILFEAYRRVTLSRSRVIGPRVMAMLCAELISERRDPSEEEEAMFAAAEQLADGEFYAFTHFVREQQQRTKNLDAQYKGLRIRWLDESIDSYWARTAPVSTGPLDLNYSIGPWAAKLKGLGILRDDMQEVQRQYYAGEQSHSLTDGVLREITWWVEMPQAYFKLVELVERSSEKEKPPNGASVY